MPSTAQSAAYKTDKTPALGVDVPGGTFQGLRGLSSLSSYPPLPHPWSSSRTLATPCSLPLLPQHFPEHRTSYYVPGHLSPALQHLTHGHTLTPTCKCLESRNLVFCFFPTPPPNEALHGPQGLNRGLHAHRVGNSGQISGSRNRSDTKYLTYSKFHSACL